MSYKHLGLTVMSTEDRSLPTPGTMPGKSRTYRSSLAFAQVLAPRGVIATQHFVRYGDEGGAESCVICLEEAATAAIVSPPCGHRFHLDCIRQWFKKRRVCGWKVEFWGTQHALGVFLSYEKVMLAVQSDDLSEQG
ncbi:hypothetical protein DL771_010287 [Monosporascus sp. 5C6A]|nr:hypothetical protein DL771_010287 [Monosporascus sp. 5C6A]